MLAILGACDAADNGRALRDGSVVIYERTLNTNIVQTESMAIGDLAADGADVVVLIRYGWLTFFEHPDLGSIDPPTSGGSATTSGGIIVAVSRDHGATFTHGPISAAADVTGEPIGVHLHAGRAWLLVHEDGIGATLPLAVHPLDLDTRVVGPAVPGQDFTYLVSDASSVALVGDTMTLHVSASDDTHTYGYFGFQEFDLSTGVFTDRVESFQYFGCVANLYADPQGQHWTGYRDCADVGRAYSMCRFDTDLAEGIPTQTCVPQAAWPGLLETDQLVVTGAGPVQLYQRGGEAYAARIVDGQAVEVALGRGEVHDDVYHPSKRLRLPLGPLLPVHAPWRLVALDSTGAATEVPLPPPLVDQPAFAPARVLALGGDTYLSIYIATLGDDRLAQTVVFRRDTITPIPVEGAGQPSPFPGCPTAIPASPLVNACAIAATCLGVDIRTCIHEWDTTALGPTTAAFEAFVASSSCADLEVTYPRAAKANDVPCAPGCIGDTAMVRCQTGTNEVVDCAARGMTCGDTPERGVGCYDATPSTCGTCDAEGRAVACSGASHIVSNCAAFGQVCSTALGPAQCVAPGCTNASTCDGARLVSCLATVDCGAAGLACDHPEGSNAMRCMDGKPDGGCAGQTCFGAKMLVEIGYERAFVDCAALGFSTCVERGVGVASCAP